MLEVVGNGKILFLLGAVRSFVHEHLTKKVTSKYWKVLFLFSATLLAFRVSIVVNSNTAGPYTDCLYLLIIIFSIKSSTSFMRLCCTIDTKICLEHSVHSSSVLCITSHQSRRTVVFLQFILDN